MDKNKLSIVLQDYFKHSAVGSKMELAIDYCEVSAGQHHPFCNYLWLLSRGQSNYFSKCCAGVC